MVVETINPQFIQTWQSKKEKQVVEEISSLSMETKRIPDPYYFLINPNGELFSPSAHCRIKDVVEKSSYVGEMEYLALLKIEQWVKDNKEGTMVWISPPAEGIYPTSKLIISEIKEQNGTKILFNRAIVLDINKQECLRLAQNLANLSSGRPFLASLDQIRSTPLVLNAGGINWTYVLEEMVDNLSLENVRQGRDIKLKNEALFQAEEIYKNLFVQKGQADLRAVVAEIQNQGMIGSYSSSCPTLLGESTAFGFFWGSAFAEKSSFSCPRCGGKIEKGKGVTTCPHCGARKEDYGNCG